MFVFLFALIMNGGTAQAQTQLKISGITVSAQATSAKITFNTNRKSNTMLEYGLDANLSPGQTTIKFDAASVLKHEVLVADMQSDKTYYYRVSTKDARGAYAASSIRSLQTAKIPSVPVPVLNLIPMISSAWQVAYDGYGFVNFDAVTGSVLFAPKVADPNGAVVDIGNTHAVLLLANQFLQQPQRNLRITVDVTTEAQLRLPVPNAWECFWLFFNYTVDAAGKKKTNYFTVKPSGIELGTAFDEVGQKFLVSEGQPTLKVGQRNVFILEKLDKVVRVYMDGVLIMNYNNAGAVDPLYDVAGTIGLYSEDARVRVHSVKVDPL